ncbi:MAG: hypothetical protein V1921_06545 [Candidatus Altiarchaeota archaeon]
MTGTKVIKLKLDGDGAAEKLPRLKEGVVEKAVEIYRQGVMGIMEESHYTQLLESTKGLDATSDALQEILEKLEKRFGNQKYFETTAGILLTTLIQNSSHDKFRIKPSIPLNYLGYNLSGDKELTVDGSVGELTGHRMGEGIISIMGDAGDNTGKNMRWGTINVVGNAGNNTGEEMTAGNINVRGNSGVRTGHAMFGGQISVGGKIKSIGIPYFGTITEAGEKVFSK